MSTKTALPVERGRLQEGRFVRTFQAGHSRTTIVGARDSEEKALIYKLG